MDSRGLWVSPNGGRAWTRAPHDVGWSPGNIDFVNRAEGWIYQLPWLYRTTDGGRSWTRLPLPIAPGTGGFVHVNVLKMSFISRTVGFLDVVPFHDGPIRLYVTNDGGATWQVRGPLPGGAAYTYFTDARAGLALGEKAWYSTKDGGRRWSVLPSPPPCRGSLVGGRFGGAFQLWACGRSFHLTTDGGSSWIVRRAPTWLKYPTAVNALTSSTWLGVSVGARLFVTTSAGRAWVVHRLAAPPHWAIPMAGFSSRRIGWAIFGREPPGGHASLVAPELRGHSAFRALVLMRTTDGGKHWTPAGPLKPTGHERA